MGYGYVQRTKPRMRVLRGYAGNSPDNLTVTAPPADGVSFKSGQILALVSGAFVLFDSASHAGLTPYIAQTDSDEQGIVNDAGANAFSLEGNYEFETPYFKDGEVITQDTPLAVGTGADAGYIIAAATPATDALIGFATHEEAGSAIRDLVASGENSEATDGRVIAFTASVRRVLS